MDIEQATKAIVDAMSTKKVKINEIPSDNISEYDILGFNPGVYVFNDDKDLVGFIEEKGLNKNENLYILRISAEGREISCSNQILTA